MADYKIIQITSDNDPDRCQAVLANGQCRNKVVVAKDGSKSSFCPRHGGNRHANTVEKASLNNYQLGVWQARIERGVSSPTVKNLRDEIAILRMTLEARLADCKTPNDLLLHSGPIGDMILKIEKVVSSCHKLEKGMNQVLDRSTILNFGGRVIQIITATIEGQSFDSNGQANCSVLIEEIGNRIFEAIGTIGEDEDASLD